MEVLEDNKTALLHTEAIYGYSTIIIDNQNKHQYIVKSFIRMLKLVQIGKKGNLHHFYLTCLKYQFSDEDNSDVILLKKLSYLWDEVEVLVNNKNEIVNVLNFKDLISRWFNIKQKLSADYKGNTVENYFLTIDNILENEKEICDFLNTYKMFGLLFNGQYGGYDKNLKKSRTVVEDNYSFSEQLTLFKKENAREVKTELLDKEQTHFENYNGTFHYENDHLIEAFLHFEKQDLQTKYSLLWIV